MFLPGTSRWRNSKRVSGLGRGFKNSRRQKRAAAKPRSKWETEEAVGLAVVLWVTAAIKGPLQPWQCERAALFKSLQVVASGTAQKEILAPRASGKSLPAGLPG